MTFILCVTKAPSLLTSPVPSGFWKLKIKTFSCGVGVAVGGVPVIVGVMVWVGVDVS
jgi:hypothetical protein